MTDLDSNNEVVVKRDRELMGEGSRDDLLAKITELNSVVTECDAQIRAITLSLPIRLAREKQSVLERKEEALAEIEKLKPLKV